MGRLTLNRSDNETFVCRLFEDVGTVQLEENTSDVLSGYPQCCSRSNFVTLSEETHHFESRTTHSDPQGEISGISSRHRLWSQSQSIGHPPCYATI